MKMKRITTMVSKFTNKVFNWDQFLKAVKKRNWKNIFGVGQDSRAILNLKSKQEIPPFESGEFVLVTESRFGGSSRLLRLTFGCKTKLKTKYGRSIAIEHDKIIGRDDSGELIHVKELPLRVKRPSLEQYVIHMKRVATPSYPKDIQAMISMAEVGEGSVVLEAGTGSGAMTLFLSRAVGKEGHVHSFDNNDKHMRNGKANFIGWLSSWNKIKLVLWPENVTFYDCTVKKCTENLPEALKLDAVLLDLQSPEHYLEHVLPAVKQEAPIVIFLPSITQVVDVIKSCYVKDLPCYVDNIIEVTHRMWKVQPVIPMNSTDTADCDSGDLFTHDIESLAVKYTAKPSFQQLPHTGFILKLLNRKGELEKGIQTKNNS